MTEQVVEVFDGTRIDLHHVIAIARCGVALHDGGVIENGCLERGMRIETDPHMHQTLHRKSKGGRIDQRAIALDEASLFELANPRPARRFRQRDPVAEFGKR